MRDAKIFQVKLLSDLFYPSSSFIQIFISSIKGVDGRKIPKCGFPTKIQEVYSLFHDFASSVIETPFILSSSTWIERKMTESFLRQDKKFSGKWLSTFTGGVFTPPSRPTFVYNSCLFTTNFSLTSKVLS